MQRLWKASTGTSGGFTLLVELKKMHNFCLFRAHLLVSGVMVGKQACQRARHIMWCRTFILTGECTY